MKKKFICVTLAVVLSGALIGCKGNGEQATVDKLVIEENVTEKKANEVSVTAEEVKLNLKEGDIFEPKFYLDGQLYGDISKGFGEVTLGDIEEYPIRGYMKGYLYTLNADNELEESKKQIFSTIIRGVKNLGYKLDRRYKGMLYSIDYRMEDVPKMEQDITSKISEATSYYKDCVPSLLYEVSGSENYYYFDSIGDITKENEQDYLYILDKENNEVFKNEIESDDRFSIFHMKEIDSFMAWGINSDVIYKVNLKNEAIKLEKYMDMKEFDEDKITFVQVMNKSEILLNYKSEVNYGTGQDVIAKTDKIVKYNFKTNEFKTIYEGSKEKYIDLGYMGSGLFSGEEFEVVDGKISYKNEYLMRLEEEDMKVIYKENMHRYNDLLTEKIVNSWPTVNEEGNEIFMTRHIMENGKSIGAIYKRYMINTN